MNELVFKGQDDQVLTNSLLVAEKFGKEHKNVLSSIRELIRGCAENSADPMFEETTYINEQNGQEYPMFIMNRDGFTLLTMGFNGKKALKFKLEYIAAFNAMEKALKEQQKPLSQLEILVQSAQALLEQSKRIDNVEKRLDAMEQEREENGRMLLAVSVSNNEVPKPTLRARCNELARTYAIGTNTDFRDVWHSVYNTMYYSYGINIKACKRLPNDRNLLDVAERKNHLGKIYDVLSNMVKSAQIDVK